MNLKQLVSSQTRNLKYVDFVLAKIYVLSYIKLKFLVSRDFSQVHIQRSTFHATGS